MAVKEPGNRKQSYRWQAVERRRDKRGEEIPAGADPAQAEAEGPAVGPFGWCGRRRGVRSRESVDSDSVLLHEDSVRGGEEDEESTNIDV